MAMPAEALDWIPADPENVEGIIGARMRAAVWLVLWDGFFAA